MPTINRTAVRVRYEEADAMGIAYYGSYFDWFTLGRTELLRSVGLPYRARFELHGVLVPVIETHCRFHRSAPLDAELEIRTHVVRLTPARVDFAYEIWLPDGDSMAADGGTRHAFVGSDGRPFDLRRRDPDLWDALRARLDVA